MNKNLWLRSCSCAFKSAYETYKIYYILGHFITYFILIRKYTFAWSVFMVIFTNSAQVINS